jgi:hypothetical protein
VEELVRGDKDDESGVFDDVVQAGGGHEVFGQGDVRQVARVQVGAVNVVGQLFAVHLGVSWILTLRVRGVIGQVVSSQAADGAG